MQPSGECSKLMKCPVPEASEVSAFHEHAAMASKQHETMGVKFWGHHTYFLWCELSMVPPDFRVARLLQGLPERRLTQGLASLDAAPGQIRRIRR